MVRATITRRICTLTHLELCEPARNFNQAIAPWEGFWVSDGSKITSLNNGLSVAPTNVRRLLYQKSWYDKVTNTEVFLCPLQDYLIKYHDMARLQIVYSCARLLYQISWYGNIINTEVYFCPIPNQFVKYHNIVRLQHGSVFPSCAKLLYQISYSI